MLQDFRFAFRTLLRQRGFTTVAVSTLSLALGVGAAVFAVIDAVFLEPPSFPEAHRLVSIWGRNPQQGQGRDVVSGRSFLDFVEDNRTFLSLAAYKSGGVTLLYGERPVMADGLDVTPGFFEVLGVKPALGRGFLPEDGRAGADRVAVIGHDLWKNVFGGDPQIIGRQVQGVQGGYRIVGVLPADFRFSQPTEFNIAVDTDRLRGLPRSAIDYWVLGRLSPGRSAGDAQADLEAILEQRARQEPRLSGWSVRVEPFQQPLVEYLRPSMTSLAGAAIALLLIALANVANLVVARGIHRRGEAAVRASLGAGGGRLARQLLMESLAFGLLCGAGGLLVAQGLLSLLPVWLPTQVPVPESAAVARLPAIGIDTSVMGFTLLMSLATALVLGAISTLQLTRVRPFEVLREGRSTPSPSTRRAQGSLVVGQLTLAVLLLTTSGFVVQNTLRLLRIHPGLQADGVLTMYIGELNAEPVATRVSYYRAVLDVVQELPTVTAAGINDYVPFQQEDDYESFRLLEAPREEAQRVEWRRVSSGYFQSAGIRLLHGRTFVAADDERAPSVVVINEALATKYFPGVDPLGKRIRLSVEAYGPSQIIGIVGNVRRRGLHVEAPPVMYVPYQRYPRPVMGLFVRLGGDPQASVHAIQDAVWSVDPRQPIDRVQSLGAILSDAASTPKMVARVVAAISLLSLAFAAVGVYAVAAYTVGLRRRELGVRAALGASPRRLLMLTLGGGIRWIATAVPLGLGAAALAQWILSRLSPGAGHGQPLPYAIALGVVALAAGVACYLPARRASRADPCTALRVD